MSVTVRSEAPKPSSRLTLGPATALVVGHTIGVGIFLTPAELIGTLASPALTFALWLVCGLGALAGALTFGDLASRYPQAGGPYVYLREGWGDSIAFLYGWQSFLIMDPGVTAALAVGLAQYIGVLWPAAAGHDRWVAVAVIWLLATFSMTGFTLSARTLATITAMKVLAFAAVVVAAFASPAGRWEHFEPFVERAASSVPLGQALAIGLVSTFFSFGGFWEASRVAGDVEDAPRVLPRALAVGIATVTLIYVAMTCAFIYVVPVRDVTSAAEFARLAGEAMFGARGAATLAGIVVLSVVSSALALLIMAPRLYIAMSRDDVFPSRLAAVDSRTGVPARAVALLATLASVFAAIGDFRQIVAFFMCTTLAFVGLAAAALPVVRRRPPHAHVANVPLVTTGMFVLLIAVVLALVTINQPFQALAGLVIVLLGIPARSLLAGRTAL